MNQNLGFGFRKFSNAGISKTLNASTLSDLNFQYAFQIGNLCTEGSLTNVFDPAELHLKFPALCRNVKQLREILLGVDRTDEFDPCIETSCVLGKKCLLNIQVIKDFKST